MADLNKKNPSVTEDALAIHLDSSGNIDRISGHGIAGTGGGGGSINYYGDDVYIKNTGAAGNIFTLTDSVKVKLDQIKSYTQGTDIIVDENNTIQVNTNGSANSTGMAFVEGSDNIASGVASHAEGKLNSAMSDYSHIEGYKNIDFEIPGQIGSNHTEGAYNDVSGVYTHIEGHANGASGYGLHVQGGYNRFYINNTAADTTHSDPTDRWNIWGISVEGMANATTAEPYSGTIGQPDFGYIHGGILKVIGNGTRTKESEDPSSESITRSDALIIYRDGSISAAGNISANGIELGAGGGGTSYQGRNGVNVDGGYIELTQTAYNAVTSIAGLSTDVGTLKVASADWNKISAKLDTTAFSTVSGNFLTEENLTEYATKRDLEIASGELLTTAQYQNDSATFLTAVPNTYALKTDIPTTVAQLTDSGNYYTKSQTSGATELSTEFAKYTKTEDLHIPTKVSDLTDSATYITETELETVSGEITALIPTNYVTSGDEISGNKQYALTTAGWAEITGGSIGDDYVPYSATKLAIGSNNNISENNSDNSFAQGTNNKVSTSPDSFVQGEANSAVNYYSLAQGYANYAQEISLAQGSNNNAITVSFAQGQHNTAKSYSIAQGTQNSADITAFAQGSANKASYDSFAQGNRNSAFSQSLAQGHYNSAYEGSFAQGKHNTACTHSLTQGSMNYADNHALAQGSDNTAKYFSQALGFGLSIQGSRGTQDGTDYVSGGLAIGTYNQTSAGVAFVIGNGHSNGSEDPTRSDAFIIYPDGRVSAAGNISANGVELGPGGGTSFTGVTTAGSISGDGLTNPLGLKTSAEQALTSVSSKVDKPDTTQAALNDKYLIIRKGKKKYFIGK